jgi:NAD(P)-dependent dehydrogenase (short-subunit alcohol dehydrogenase family)
MLLVAPENNLSDRWLRDALFAAQRLRHDGVLATVSRLDGAFGFHGSPWREPIDGGLAGLAKTVRRERPAARAKAIDLSPNHTDAALVVEEFLLDGPDEVGLSPRGKVTLAYSNEPVGPPSHVPFQPGDVVVVTGGARGVTAEVAVALARAFRPTLVLLGRSPEPAPEPDGFADLHDEPSVRREVGRREPALSPREIGERARALLAAREVRHTLDRIRQAGGKAIYQSVDVRDAAAVRRALAGHGPVRGLVHGAGVLADAKIEDKTAAQFDAVYQTKVAGLRALLAAVGDELRALVLFSSSTARFGRAGQVDYAMANEVLNKLAWQEAARRPGCRVVSFNWGPWDGGMVNAGLKQLFAREGVGVIPLEAGAQLLIDELRAGPDGPREVVVLARAAAPTPLLPPALPTAFERVLDVAEYPVLASHVLDGRPVLPAALMLEWLAHAAMVQNPGLAFHGCDDLRVLQGVVLDGPAPTLRVGAAKATRRDGLFVAAAELRSVRPDGREVLHARAEVVLANALPAAPEPQPLPALDAYPLTPDEVYRQGVLFHGPDLRCLERVEGCGEAGVVGVVRAAPAAAEWMRQPLRKDWLSDPLVIDGAFQLAIVWTHEQRGAGSLPAHVSRYRQYRRAFPAGGVRVAVAVERAGDRHAIMDVDFVDPDGGLVARIEGYECVLDANLAKAFQKNGNHRDTETQRRQAERVGEKR